MRLIDADALMEEIKVSYDLFEGCEYIGDKSRRDELGSVMARIYNAPTVETDWISVEEELPEISEHHISDVVLCYCKGGVYAFSELEENIFGQKCFSCERDDEYYCNPLKVIAWMPLPKFNEEDEA